MVALILRLQVLGLGERSPKDSDIPWLLNVTFHSSCRITGLLVFWKGDITPETNLKVSSGVYSSSTKHTWHDLFPSSPPTLNNLNAAQEFCPSDASAQTWQLSTPVSPSSFWKVPQEAQSGRGLINFSFARSTSTLQAAETRVHLRETLMQPVPEQQLHC
ncbi:hypothetical protein P7K49_014812 [Saguinus oedipus]|uniref:Uncharacterized protein n=1 Tax=Saguinus oedipus TaxID=9490 RepID=A0ABQ9V7F6_SAGOE|nr:hypothetical protein P7K49_014812 [Saguinus oedipus]